MANWFFKEYLIYFHFWLMFRENGEYLTNLKNSKFGLSEKMAVWSVEMTYIVFLHLLNLVQLSITKSWLILAPGWILAISHIQDVWILQIFVIPPHYVGGLWRTRKLWIFHFRPRYLNAKHICDIECLNFFCVLDVPIFSVLHQPKHQNSVKILKKLSNITIFRKHLNLRQFHQYLLFCSF